MFRLPSLCIQRVLRIRFSKKFPSTWQTYLIGFLLYGYLKIRRFGPVTDDDNVDFRPFKKKNCIQSI